MKFTKSSFNPCFRLSLKSVCLLIWLCAFAPGSLLAQLDYVPFEEPMNPRLKAYYDELVQTMPTDAELGVLSAADFSNVVYIDPSATSQGNGSSPESPLTSWTQVSWAPHTAYLQKRGTEAVVSPYLATGANDILLGAYGEGPRPILRPAAPVSGDHGTVRMQSNQRVTLRDMYVFGTGLASTVKLGHGDITLFNNRLEDTVWGVRGHSVGTGFRFIGNLIHNTELDGIFLQYHNAINEVEVAWNHIFNTNTRWEDPYTPETVAGGDAVFINGSTHVHIHHNVLDRTITGNKFSIICNQVGSNMDLVHGLIEYNYLTSPRDVGDGGAIIYIQRASDWVIRYNIFDGDLEERRLGAIFNATEDMTLYGNLFIHTGAIANHGNTARIYHNVFWDMPGNISTGGNAILRNNIIDNRRTLNSATGTSVFANNLLTTSAVGDASNIVGDPLFVDPDNWDFRLSPGSPAIDAGVVITDTDIEFDRLGTPIPFGSAPDIGAFEFAESGEPNTATIPVPKTGFWMTRHDNMVARVKADEIDVMLLGDSITDMWSSAGASVWASEFGHYKMANFGIDADRTQHVLWRLQNGLSDGFAPRAVVLCIGTNNTGFDGDGTPRNTPTEAIAGITLIVEELRTRFPETQILLFALFPRSEPGLLQRLQVEEINAGIAHLHDGELIHYIDMGDQYMDSEGNILLSLMPDRLHPSQAGYQVWADNLRDPLNEILSWLSDPWLGRYFAKFAPWVYPEAMNRWIYRPLPEAGTEGGWMFFPKMN